MRLTSPAFADGSPIPQKHTADGLDLSPPLRWSELPDGTQALALIVEDPDAPAGTWVHWLAWDIRPDVEHLPEGVVRAAHLPGGMRQGRNDFGRLGWGGPAPPPGPLHHYRFELFALDQSAALQAGADASRLRAHIRGTVLDSAVLVGMYGR